MLSIDISMIRMKDRMVKALKPKSTDQHRCLMICKNIYEMARPGDTLNERDQPVRRRPEAQRTPPPGHRSRIPSALVIATSSTLQSLLSEFLANHRWLVRAAGGGHQAIQLARDNPPDAVIMALPLRLPSAEATIQALRIEHGTTLPLVALTAPASRILAEGLDPCAVVEVSPDNEHFLAAVKRGLDVAARPKPRGARATTRPGRRARNARWSRLRTARLARPGHGQLPA